MIILSIHVITLLLLAFRIMLFGARGRRRPIIAMLAYMLMVASFTGAIQAGFGVVPPPSLLSVVLEIALTIAVFCHHGNVAHLYQPQGCKSRLSKMLCWSPKRKKVIQ